MQKAYILRPGQATCNHTFNLLPACVKKKNSPPLSHHQHRFSTHGSTSLSSHGERRRLARSRWPPGPWWSGVSPRWHSRRAAECKQDTGGWRDGGMEEDGWRDENVESAAFPPSPGRRKASKAGEIQSSHKPWTALRLRSAPRTGARSQKC